MKKVAVLKIDYTYADVPESEDKLNRFYTWLINKAIDNLLKKQKTIDNNSTQKYTKSNGRSGDISNPRRSSQNSQSQENYNLQDVPSGQASSSQIWQGMEDQKLKTRSSTGG